MVRAKIFLLLALCATSSIFTTEQNNLLESGGGGDSPAKATDGLCAEDLFAEDGEFLSVVSPGGATLPTDAPPIGEVGRLFTNACKTAAVSASKAFQDGRVRVSGAAAVVIPQLVDGTFHTSGRSLKTRCQHLDATADELTKKFDPYSPTDIAGCINILAQGIREHPEYIDNEFYAINHTTLSRLAKTLRLMAKIAADAADRLDKLNPTVHDQPEAEA